MIFAELLDISLQLLRYPSCIRCFWQTVYPRTIPCVGGAYRLRPSISHFCHACMIPYPDTLARFPRVSHLGVLLRFHSFDSFHSDRMSRVGSDVRVVADGQQYRFGDAARCRELPQFFRRVALRCERGEFFGSRIEERREIRKMHVGISKLAELFEKKNDVRMDEVCGKGVDAAFVSKRNGVLAKFVEKKLIPVGRKVLTIYEARKVPPRVRHTAGHGPPDNMCDICDGDTCGEGKHLRAGF